MGASELGQDPIAIGRLAVKRGLLSNGDLKSCVQHVAQVCLDKARNGDKDFPKLADVLVQRKLLTREDVLELEAALRAPVTTDAHGTTRRAESSASQPAAFTAEEAISTTRRPSPLYETTKRQPSPLREDPSEAPTIVPTVPPASEPSLAQPPPTGPVTASPPRTAVPRPSPQKSSAIAIGATPSAAARRSFGKYMLVRELGRGGMSVVWEGLDTDLKRRVAIKFLTGVGGRYVDAAQEEILKRFYREAHSAAKLHHENIVKIYEVGELDGQHYIAMEYIDGDTLYDLTIKKKVDMRQVVSALRDSARALDHAHRNGILHRDIKPQNIMIDKAGHTYIMDFGLARDLKEDERLTLSGIAIGTPNYMPPEHAQGSKNVIDVRSDVYSLGAVLYEMLAGRPPFPGDTPMAVMLAVVNQDPQRPASIRPGVPVDLETVCLKAMAKDKERRYPSAQSMADDLDRWLRGEQVQARRGSFTYGMKRKVRRAVVPLVAGLVVIAVGVGWGVYALRQSRERQRFVRESLAKGRDLAAKGDYDAAILLLQEALKLDPGSAEAARDLASARQKEEERRRAEEARRREDERQSKLKSLVAEASRLWHAGQGDKSRPTLEEILKLDPRHADALHWRGKLFEGEGKYDEAMADWQLALETNPKYACVLCDMSDGYRRKNDRGRARECLLKALEADPNFTEANHKLGHASDNEGDFEAAERYFTAAIRSQRFYKYYSDRAEVRAKLYHKGGHKDEEMIRSAFTDAETSLGLFKSWNGYLARGNCQVEKQQFAKAIADYEEGLKLDPKNTRLKQALADARKRASQPHD
jgi:serine/threonine protein kinase/Tfp pilus assembly protein PilF